MALAVVRSKGHQGCNTAVGALLEDYGFGNALERHRLGERVKLRLSCVLDARKAF